MITATKHAYAKSLFERNESIEVIDLNIVLDNSAIKTALSVAEAEKLANDLLEQIREIRD